MRDERQEQLRVELIARLAGVRGDVTKDEFDKLVAARGQLEATGGD